MLDGRGNHVCVTMKFFEAAKYRMFTMVKFYIPSCDIVAHVYLGSSVGRSHALRAESPGFEPRLVGFFSLFISTSY